jgi:pre-mRNA-processing factor 6
VLLKSKLDRAEHQLAGQSNVDRVGYITQLNSHKLDADFLGDVKKARVLLKSALASNPKNPDIWLSAARVEELDGKIKDCREVLRKAIEACPLSEDLWMELSRIEKPEQAKDVLIEGLRFLPSSEKLWLFAARREDQNKELKSKILRKGL